MIAYRDFAKRYGALVAVERLTFTVERGEVVALLGPNGSGKTTALKAAAGLLAPSAGTVTVEGLPAASPVARRVLSYLPQKVAFSETATGREILDFYRALRGAPGARVGEALAFASLNGAGDRAVATYSGGMVQRLGLAVAVLPETPLLVLDEPTASLDPEGMRAFYGVVEGHRREGRTVLFSSHQLGDLERLADRFAVLVGGRLASALSRRDLAAALDARGAMRLRLAPSPPALAQRLPGIVRDASWDGDELVISGGAAERPAALEALRAAGVEILGLTTVEGRLDDLYRELVAAAGEETGGSHGRV